MRLNIGEKGIYDMYRFYRERIKDPLSFELFRKIIFQHNRQLMTEVLQGAANVRLPNRLGFIRVRKTKMNYKHLKFDYGTYNKTGVKAFHLNEHSDDFKARVLWDKSRCIVKGKRPWSFKPSRENARMLSTIMKEEGGHKRYTEEL